MMTMTKRDIADIVLVGMGVKLLGDAIHIIALDVGFYTRTPQTAENITSKFIDVPSQVLHIALLLFVIYLLLFGRKRILSLIVPDGPEKEVTIPAGLAVLASYAFWIRLLGIFTFLSSGIRLVGDFAMSIGIYPKLADLRYWFVNSAWNITSTILGAVVIWKADWLAEKLGKKGSPASLAPTEP